VDVRCDAWSIGDGAKLITHAQFAFAENTREFLPVFKVALQKRGLPQRIFVEYVARHIFHNMFPVGKCGQ